MKRSDMLLNIATTLMCEYTNFLSWDKAQLLAEEVLNRCLQDGMLPPSCEFKMGDMIVRDNCWEPENE